MSKIEKRPKFPVMTQEILERESKKIKINSAQISEVKAYVKRLDVKIEEIESAPESEEKEVLLIDLKEQRDIGNSLLADNREIIKTSAMADIEINRLYVNLRNEISQLKTEFFQITDTLDGLYKNEGIQIPKDIFDLGHKINNSLREIDDIHLNKEYTVYYKYAIIETKMVEIRKDFAEFMQKYEDHKNFLRENSTESHVLDVLEPLEEDIKVIKAKLTKIEELPPLPEQIRIVEQQKEEVYEKASELLEKEPEIIERVDSFYEKYMKPVVKIFRGTNSILIAVVGIAAFFGIAISRKK